MCNNLDDVNEIAKEYFNEIQNTYSKNYLEYTKPFKIKNINKDKKLIFDYYKIDISILFGSKLYHFDFDSYVYFETNDSINSDDKFAVSPFKNAIDCARCGKDVLRNKFLLNNKKIEIKNYNDDKIMIIIDKENIELKFILKDENDEKFYMTFFSTDDTNIKKIIKINNKFYKICNNIREVFDNIIIWFNKLLKSKITIHTFEKIIKIGVFMKRLGDYLQVQIFNNINIHMFQTNDYFCFFIWSIMCKS